jgi:hypothetical protein
MVLMNSEARSLADNDDIADDGGVWAGVDVVAVWFGAFLLPPPPPSMPSFLPVVGADGDVFAIADAPPTSAT